MSVSIISNLPLRPCSRGQERGGCLFTCRWRLGVAAALLRCSRAIRPGSKCGGCWRRILFWSDCYLSTLPQLHPLCTSPPSTCGDTSGRYQALRRLLFHDGAFPFLSVLFLSDPWPSFSCLFISVLSGSFSCSASLSCRIKQVNNKLFFLSHFWIFLFLVSQKQFSQLPSPLLLSSADPVHTNLLSEAERLWSRTTASGAPWCGPSGAPLQWGWCLIKPPASTPSMPVLPWPPPSVGAVEVHRTHTLYYKLPVLELPLFFTAVCV